MKVVQALPLPGWRWWLIALAVAVAVSIAMPVFGQTITGGKNWNLTGSSVQRLAFDAGNVAWSKPYENRVISLNGASNTYTVWTHGNTSILGPNNYGSAVPTGTFVWATAESIGHFNRLNTADGQLLSWQLPAGLICGRKNLAVDSTGAAFAGTNGQKIAKVDPVANTITEWPLPTAGSYCPTVFAVEGSGASQKVWFCEAAIDKIGFLAPDSGSVTEWEIPGNNFNDCSSLDASGRVWFSRTSTEILKLAPATNELTIYPLPLGYATVQGVSPEVTGRVWFATSSQIKSFAPATGQFVDYTGTSCSPDSLFIDGAGNVWTTTQGTTVCRFPAP